MVGCSLKLAQKKPEGEQEFFQETCRLEKLARDHPETSVRAQSHLKLAILSVNYRNPQLNYTRALQEMESYLSLVPTKKQTDDFNNWLAVLKEIEKLQTGLEKAQKATRSLREEVAGLKETIDRLKSLDRQMEEKRRLTK
jgi:outer membrane protein assembly factor BamD (BamD/ComL family)